MRNPIGALVAWLLAVFGPRPCGRCRPLAPDEAAALYPAPVPVALPRSPYGLDVPIDGAETALVRPYLVADERRQRRLALVLAADFGIDLDTRVLHGAGVA